VELQWGEKSSPFLGCSADSWRRGLFAHVLTFLMKGYPLVFTGMGECHPLRRMGAGGRIILVRYESIQVV
jgi:hypothetical protein